MIWSTIIEVVCLSVHFSITSDAIFGHLSAHIGAEVIDSRSYVYIAGSNFVL